MTVVVVSYSPDCFVVFPLRRAQRFSQPARPPVLGTPMRPNGTRRQRRPLPGRPVLVGVPSLDDL